MKDKRKLPITFECRATKVENALEKAYSEIGSKHNVKRNQIFFEKDEGVEEISVEEAREPLFEEIEQDDFVIYR